MEKGEPLIEKGGKQRAIKPGKEFSGISRTLYL